MQPSSPSPTISTVTETALTYDEVSMHRSRHFVMALQELKNLRPQLHSAAEYCESSYLYSEQKQAVLENLKDYSVKALVNAVDHLGTVACKLNDLLDQQNSEIVSADLRISSLAQRYRTCQEYTDREALKQQCLYKTYPRHHKHYSFPENGDVELPKSPVTGPESQNDSPRMVSTGKSPRVQEIERDASTYGTPGRAGVDSKAGSPQPMASSNGTRRDVVHDTLPVSPKVVSGGTPRSNKGSPAEESKSLSSLMSTDGERPTKDLRSVPSRSKNMFMSLLGKTKSLKSSKSTV
ncbi:probable protein ABIL4 [Selaginella moellendorffii]|uniref:probable protein ABIL4 n=1 Tax=Selaginella moellendorffii TaxID=88036 RepID=UPI000D1C4C9A|nr:probable protein ABIL4 [Selaginella moellendorffii]|eukprot:XP_002982709.2 probable protein ABIL4 [Selaginella moellendorffii]